MTLYRKLSVLMLICMILGTHKGYIAIFQNNSNIPSKVFPYRAALLPTQEQHRLEEGIVIYSKEHLDDLLMNYLS